MLLESICFSEETYGKFSGMSIAVTEIADLWAKTIMHCLLPLPPVLEYTNHLASTSVRYCGLLSGMTTPTKRMTP